MNAITDFEGNHRYLSNFHPAQVELDGLTYRTTEHAYQAAKTLDPVERNHVRAAPTPGSAKRRGQQVTKRADWEDVKLSVMRKLLEQKFTQPGFRICLLSTGDAELVEGNNWKDTFWGVCGGVGHNHLGKLLMEIRKELRNAR